jgi:hypothetical protein
VVQRVIRWSIVGVRWVAPWLLRIAWFSLRLVALTVVAWWVGIPRAVTNMAQEWVMRAAHAGFPSEYEQVLYYGACMVAIGVVSLGWVMAAYLTVGAIGLLF